MWLALLSWKLHSKGRCHPFYVHYCSYFLLNFQLRKYKVRYDKSSNDLTYSADHKTISRNGGYALRRAYVEGFLHRRGTSQLCIEATRYSGFRHYECPKMNKMTGREHKVWSDVWACERQRHPINNSYAYANQIQIHFHDKIILYCR